MTLNFMPLVILFGLALLLVGRTNDQQTQQTAMNMSICVLAISIRLFKSPIGPSDKPTLRDGFSRWAPDAV